MPRRGDRKIGTIQSSEVCLTIDGIFYFFVDFAQQKNDQQ